MTPQEFSDIIDLAKKRKERNDEAKAKEIAESNLTFTSLSGSKYTLKDIEDTLKQGMEHEMDLVELFDDDGDAAQLWLDVCEELRKRL